LKVEIETLQPSRKRLRIEIPADRVQSELAKNFAALQKNAQVPGFRRSRAPLAVIRARYGEAVKSDVIQSLVPEVCQEALDENELEIVGDAILDPPLAEMKVVEGEGLAFILDVDVKPEIEVPDLTTLEADKRNVDVSEEEVNRYLERLRESRAEFVDAEEARPVAADDAVYVDWREQAEDEDEPDIDEDVLIAISQLTREPYVHVAQALVGMQIGESKSVSITYPMPEGEEPEGGKQDADRIGGKTGRIDVTVKRVGKNVIPELDDAFARSLNYEDVARLRAASWNGLVEEAKARQRDEQRRDLIEQLINKTTFEVPEAVVLQQRRRLTMNALANRQRYGVQTDSEGVEELYNSTREYAEKIVRRDWVFDQIAATESIDVTEADITAHVHAQARQRGQDPEKYEARIRAAEQWDDIGMMLRNERILDLLLERAAEKRQIIY